jgi:alkylation response protein AidB-like acyl-CoA dehydrogenase
MATGGFGIDLLALVRAHPDDRGLAEQAGSLLAEGQSMSLLNLRSAERAVAGSEPGPEGNVAKLVNGEHEQRVADFALAVTGAEAALLDGASPVGTALIFTRCLTIAGGTSEIVRNQIGERILGLPRDPLVN